ncbi:hypothetical protein [Rhodoferax sp. GW822-FHT02A01]|uniref:hypothetical protein n=1 Tax=Rhodoferax sp. GW822-FHT02A01 TaxID=3141537 RepID=UPI00315DF8DF
MSQEPSCMTCKYSDSFGLPDCVQPHSCGDSKAHWVPLNTPIQKSPKDIEIEQLRTKLAAAEAERDAALAREAAIHSQPVCTVVVKMNGDSKSIDLERLDEMYELQVGEYELHPKIKTTQEAI